ncbi:MAG: hypothetical protein QOJ79_2607 [Actinomycetota bacterium]|nr:hypothetical protein [Actinomycetota bacterium]
MYKLTQKVRVSEGAPADLRITNTYLSREEYDVLKTLPAAAISKVRSIHRHGSHEIAVDTFQHRLRGLRLAEVEVQDLDEPIELPAWVGPEITYDNRYTGGYLASASDDDIRGLLEG